jgi:hypothetical protein
MTLEPITRRTPAARQAIELLYSRQMPDQAKQIADYLYSALDIFNGNGVQVLRNTDTNELVAIDTEFLYLAGERLQTDFVGTKGTTYQWNYQAEHLERAV